MHGKLNIESCLHVLMHTLLSLVFVALLVITKFLSLMTFNVSLNVRPTSLRIENLDEAPNVYYLYHFQKVQISTKNHFQKV